MTSFVFKLGDGDGGKASRFISFSRIVCKLVLPLSEFLILPHFFEYFVGRIDYQVVLYFANVAILDEDAL